MNATTVLVGTAGLLVLGGLRPAVDELLRTVLGLPGLVARASARDRELLRGGLLRRIARTHAALDYRGPDATVPPTRPAWNVVAPLTYGVLAAVTVGGDLLLAGLRFGALLGVPVTGLPVSGTGLDALLGTLFVAVSGTFGAVWCDLGHVTPLRRPFGAASGSWRTALTVVAAVGTATSVVAGVLFFVWGQGAVDGQPDPELATAFVGLFAGLLVTANVLALAGAVALPVVVCLAALRVRLWAHDAGTRATVRTVAGADGALAVAQAVLRVLAWPGETVWNWVAAMPFAGPAHLRPLPGGAERPAPEAETLRLVTDPRPRDDAPAGEVRAASAGGGTT